MMRRVPDDSPGTGSSLARDEGRGAVARLRALARTPAQIESNTGV